MATAELVSGMDDYRLKPPLFWSVVHDRLPDKKPSSPRFSEPACANPWTHLRARVGYLINFIPFLLCKLSPSGTRIIKVACFASLADLFTRCSVYPVKMGN
ncbi:hypothetical protein M5K25_022998 [Dendrobium thyrsiflorum]|uniref:Uncharacterized protein n=1 Tax=Dendrobium thyrsiflorum TaxID=117978 RepID=A0ABD0UDR4_DENTH